MQLVYSISAIRFRKAKQEMALLKEAKKANEAKKRFKRPIGRPCKPKIPVVRPKGYPKNLLF